MKRGGDVHKGFLKGLDEVWDGEDGLFQCLEKLVKEKKNRPMWITGHSLGGALAALCFARLHSASGLYIFGAPRVGDQEFVDLLENRPVFRVEHGRDPIPMVPPDVPKLNFNFKDLGKLIFINHEGEILLERPEINADEEKKKVLTTMSEQKKRRDSLSVEGIKDLFDIEKVKKLSIEINDHLLQSIDEWKEYFQSLDDGIGLKIQDHMPIYYCSHLWNLLD